MQEIIRKIISEKISPEALRILEQPGKTVKVPTMRISRPISPLTEPSIATPSTNPSETIINLDEPSDNCELAKHLNMSAIQILQDILSSVLEDSASMNYPIITLSSGKKISINQCQEITIPDIHGRLESFVACLRTANLIDKDGNWCGGRRRLILLGDLIDKGPYSWQVVLYALGLQQQAKAANGQVKILIGNHEAYLLTNEISEEEMNCGMKNLIGERALLRTLIEKEVTVRNIQAVYADDTSKTIHFHAGLSERVLRELLTKMGYDLNNSDNPFSYLRQHNIRLNDLGNRINKQLVDDILNEKLLINSVITHSNDSITSYRGRDNVFFSTEEHQDFYEIVGHLIVPESNRYLLKNQTLFIDDQLVNGNCSFLARYEEGESIEYFHLTSQNNSFIHSHNPNFFPGGYCYYNEVPAQVNDMYWEYKPIYQISKGLGNSKALIPIKDKVIPIKPVNTASPPVSLVSPENFVCLLQQKAPSPEKNIHPYINIPSQVNEISYCTIM